MASSGQRNERNELIWHQGLVRNDLLLPSIPSNSPYSSCGHYSPMSVSSWNFQQVAEWMSSIGMGQYSTLFCHHQTDGGRLLTTDASSIVRMGVENTQHALHIENCIRELNRSKREAVGQIETLPCMHYRALSLGQPPPQRYYGELLYQTVHQQ